MKFTAFWLLPPIGLLLLPTSLGDFKRHNDWRVIPVLVAFIWLGIGIRAVRRYWRGRWYARGAKDVWRS